MAAPQEGYPAQGFPPAEPYAQPGYAGEAPTGPPSAGPEQHEGGKKKKRGYAAQAYDFGAGANSALGGQTHGGAAAGFPPAQAPAYGGYPPQPDAQPAAYGGAPQYGAPPEVVGAPLAGAPVQPGFAPAAPYGSGVGGYQAPEPGYPGPGAPPAGGVAGITQGMGQMGMGGPAQPQPPQAVARPAVLNHLYPTDLLTQPFSAAELELPPPPIILPANVSCNCASTSIRY
jgi:protein transport protein SEC24